MQLGPGQSPHGASPLTGAKQCFAYFRFAPVSSKNGVRPCTPPFGFFPPAPSLRKGP